MIDLYWILAPLAAFFVGLGKGGVPVIALIAVPILSLVMSPIAAAGLLLPVYIISDMFALHAYRREFDKTVLTIGIIGMTCGVAIGWATAHILIEWVITFLMGLMGLLFALKMIFDKKPKPTGAQKINKPKGLFWSVIAGFTSFLSHNGGPPWQIFTLPLNLPKLQFVGTSVIAFAYVNIIKLVPYYALGHLNFGTVKASLYLMPFSAFAVYFGVWVIKKIPEEIFYKIVTWALLIVSLKLIWDGLRQSSLL